MDLMNDRLFLKLAGLPFKNSSIRIIKSAAEAYLSKIDWR